MNKLPSTLHALQQAIAAGAWSVEDALACQHERAKILGARYGCAVSYPDRIPRDALPQGPLRGIGLAHKDLFDMPDFRPGLGRDAGAVDPGRREAPVLQRLRLAGATHLARLAMAEHACGATGVNPRLAPCINPWHPDAVVGGSSSGSGVALACGLAYGSLGTDTAGSVRIPAAATGVLGLKTTYGLLPVSGVAPLAPALDSVGILTRSAADAARLLSIVSGTELPARAPSTLNVQAWLPDELSPDLAKVWATFLRSNPQVPVQRPDRDLETLSALSEVLLCHEASRVHRDDLLAGKASPGVAALAVPGLAIADDWAEGLRQRRSGHLRAFVASHLEAYDLILLPAFTSPVPDVAQVSPGDPRFEGRRLLDLYRLMGFVNYLGLPSVVFPIGTDERGLPVSVQAIARPYEDATLLAWAGWHELRMYGDQGFPSPQRFTI